MKTRGITIEKLCTELHISRSAFYRKCNGISEFTQGEIQRIVDYIGLDSPMGIFLQTKCLKRHIMPRLYNWMYIMQKTAYCITHSKTAKAESKTASTKCSRARKRRATYGS